MATVTGFTAARMLEIENESVVDGNIVGDDLVLLTRAGTPINTGNVRGPQGIQGPVGEVTTAQMNAAIEASRATIQAAGAVTNAMIALGAITTDRIANLAVTTAKLADGAVTTAKIGDAQVTSTKLADGSIVASKYADRSIGTVKIALGAIMSGEIADGHVTTPKLADGAVDYYKQNVVWIQSSAPPAAWGRLWVYV